MLKVAKAEHWRKESCWSSYRGGHGLYIVFILSNVSLKVWWWHAKKWI